jgi:hypothetical protein
VDSIGVNVENFERAESNRMLNDLAGLAGGINTVGNFRVPTPLDQQPVIRLNRDTLYSWAVVDINDGATVTLPDAGERYVSVMIVNQDHYINRVLHEPGEHDLTMDEFGTQYVLVAMRTLVDPADPADVAAVNTVQDGFSVRATSAEPFVMPAYDETSFNAVRKAILELARFSSDYSTSFGTREAVDPVMHLLGTASGWGGLPAVEASYVNVDPGLPVGEYRVTVKDVPVDAFWSISLYNADGFFEENAQGANSINSITGTPNADRSITVHFGGCGDDRPNCLPIMDGWNFLVRLYRPRAEILDGTWKFPEVEPIT